MNIKVSATGSIKPRLTDMLPDLKEYVYVGNELEVEKFRKLTGKNPPSNKEKCICGNKIQTNFYIHNKNTKNTLIVGSTCLKHFKDIYGLQFKRNVKECAWCSKLLNDNRKNHCDDCKNNKDLLCDNITCFHDGVVSYSRCSKTKIKKSEQYCPICNKNYYSCSYCYKKKCYSCPDPHTTPYKKAYFVVSFYDKDKAKHCGAWWDSDKKLWYSRNQTIHNNLMEAGFKPIIRQT